jgi:penicillin G amidase
LSPFRSRPGIPPEPAANRRWPRSRPARFALRAGGILAALCLLPLVALAAAIFLSLPGRDAQTRILGLSAPVQVALDPDGVPRIRAANAHDAAMALGWLHARDRAFQMDAMRRLASGRLSEIAGRTTLPLDRLMRTLGLRRRAAADLAILPPDVRDLLQAYADGVNARLRARGRFAAPEFVLLGDPAPWTPVDSLMWEKLMGQWLGSNWRTEAGRLAAEPQVPLSRLLAFWPGLPGPGATAWRLAPLLPIPRFPAPWTEPEEASDTWAVDGAHSASGHPLLAGDPHLGLDFPSIWYLARIDTPQGVLAGATAPGVPFLVLGHNGHIAWSFTTTGADTEDLFVETILPDGRYATPDGPRAFLTHQETIHVRGAPDETITIRETRHGPVVSDADPTPGGQVLALASTALLPDDTAATGLLALDRANSVAQAADAATLITVPVQNLLVADAQHIALFTTGRVPIRRAGDGAAPVAGADGAHDWIGLAAGAQLPRFQDPPSGRLVNSNEPTWPANFPILIARDTFGPWRADRIRTLLDAIPHATAEQFAAMQVDPVSAWAQQILPALRRVPSPPGLPARALALLQDWNGAMTVNAPQPLILEAWMQRFYLDLLAANHIPEGASPWLELVAHALTPDGWDVCATDCTPALQRALSEATDALAVRFGQDPAAWRWGDAHTVRFASPLFSAVPGLGFLSPTRAIPGSDSTLFRAGNRPGALTARHGAEFRGVYDLADLARSRFMLAPGQSGDPFSPHAQAFLERWASGTTVQLTATPATVAERLELQP